MLKPLARTACPILYYIASSSTSYHCQGPVSSFDQFRLPVP
jgi:hypothetical protein